MIWSLVLAVFYLILAVIVSYAYIRMAIAQETENKLLKQQNDLLNNKQKEDIKFKISGQDLISLINKNVTSER